MNSSKTIKEQLWLLMAQLGDEQAFEHLVMHYHPRVLYFIRRYTNDYDCAEDIIQNVWLKVWKGLPKLKHLEAFNVWLYRIARNQVIQDFRLQKQFISFEPDLMGVQDEEHETLTPEQADQIHSALKRLNPIHREVILLRFLEEMNYQNMAEVIGCSLGTIRSRLFYAKKALRDKMEKQDE